MFNTKTRSTVAQADLLNLEKTDTLEDVSCALN